MLGAGELEILGLGDYPHAFFAELREGFIVSYGLRANFGNLLDAICGLLVVLSSQFHTNDFLPGPMLLAEDKPGEGTEDAFVRTIPAVTPEIEKALNSEESKALVATAACARNRT